MQYRIDERSGNKLSILGFGCMRLPRGVGGIDLKKTEEMVMRAVENGVNYFDTAYLYPGSETALGKILDDHQLREQVYIATKLPIMSCHSGEDFDRFLTKQLDRLGTAYIDYYLLHNIGTLEQWRQLCAWGMPDWIARQKQQGSLRQIGFSFHGTRDEFRKILGAYDWDCCLIQYNYADENAQAGVAGLQLAADKNIPVMVMEPLLGGRLATGLPKKAVGELRGVRPDLTPAAWGLRWLWDQPQVTVVLSGMSADAQIDDNLRTANTSTPGMLTDTERRAYRRVVEIFRESYKIPCTGCGYCMPCPKGVNIPGCFAAYNTSYALGRITGMIQYTTGTGAHHEDNGMAGRCTRCGNCVRHCPQEIAVPDALRDVGRRMEPFYYRWVMSAMHRHSRRRS